MSAVAIVGVGQLSFLFGMRQWSMSIAVTERTSQLLDEELMAITGGLPGIEHLERPEYADRIALVRQERRRRTRTSSGWRARRNRSDRAPVNPFRRCAASRCGWRPGIFSRCWESRAAANRLC